MCHTCLGVLTEGVQRFACLFRGEGDVKVRAEIHIQIGRSVQGNA